MSADVQETSVSGILLSERNLLSLCYAGGMHRIRVYADTPLCNEKQGNEGEEILTNLLPFISLFLFAFILLSHSRRSR